MARIQSSPTVCSDRTWTLTKWRGYNPRLRCVQTVLGRSQNGEDTILACGVFRPHAQRRRGLKPRLQSDLLTLCLEQELGIHLFASV